MKNQVINENFVSESVLKIGSVSEVKGKNIIIRVDKNKNAPHLIFDGRIIKNVSVGSYVKIAKGYNEIIGKIEGEFISEDKDLDINNYTNHKNKIKRFLNVTLVGYIESSVFKQGLKELPLIDNDCFLLNDIEFNCIHSFAKKDEDKIKLGYLLNETNTPIELGVDKLFASHIGIFGNTGSGKSYTLSKIYHELLSKYKENPNFQKNAKFILIDFNGEYARDEKNDNIIIEEKFKNRFFLSTSKSGNNQFPINSKILNDTKFWSILLKATEQTQTPFLSNSLNNDYLEKGFESEVNLKNILINHLKLILTQTPKNLDRNLHLTYIDEILKFDKNKVFKDLKTLKVDYQSNLNFYNGTVSNYDNNGTKINLNTNSDEFNRIVIEEKINSISINISQIGEFQKVRLKIILNYYFGIIKGYFNKEHIGPLIGRLDSKFNSITKLFKISDENIFENEKILSIVSLNDVNDIEMKKLVPLIICKYYYEHFKDNNKNRDEYLNIIVDEAHNILSRSSIRESETWKDYRLETFEEIIKEGRKFGVFLTIASQRPYDISDTIISQLHNYFLHRLINNKDIEAIGRTVSYLDKISFDSLSILPQGGCILAGLSADLPVVMKIDKLPDENKPHNETIVLSDKWK